MPPKHGLSESLQIPIAAKSVDAIEKYVGPICKASIKFTDINKRRIIAAFIVNRDVSVNLMDKDIPLWNDEGAATFWNLLHPGQEVWVHVRFQGYRKYWCKNFSNISNEYFLDHIQNRKAMLVRGLSHPYVRLQPVTRQVNTDSGTGQETLEKERLEYLKGNLRHDDFLASVNKFEILYADPGDLTKMLNIGPGGKLLKEVSNIHHKFFRP